MSILKIVEENRVPILLAEIGAYLHDLGKATKDFIEGNSKEAGNQRPSHTPPKLFPDELRKILSEVKIDVLNEKASIMDFIEHHHNRELETVPKLVALISAVNNGFDGIDSGVDKGKVESKQSKEHTFISSAFGFENYKIEIDEIDRIKEEMYRKIEEHLTRFQKSSNDIETLYKVIFCTKKYYLLFLGETRRPANDVTLWDHSYSVATMMKCAVAQEFLKPENTFDPLHFDWKVFAVNFDVLGLLTKGIKIGDIKGYWKSVEKIFEEVKKMIEVTYPIGNEIFRDTKGIYFLTAAVELHELKEEILKKIRGIEPEIMACITEIPLETKIPPEEQGDRKTIEAKKKELLLKSIPEARKKALERVSFPAYSEGFPCNEFGPENNKEVCPICRLRTVERGKEICNHCLNRRTNRSQEWQMDPKSSIWIDEISDHNDRVALVVGMFKIDEWLNGSFIQTLTFNEPSTENASNPRNNDVRKHPSPARIRRVWETTEEFIRETVFKGILNNYEYPALRKQRIELEINPNPKVPEGSTCDISISGVRFSPVCVDSVRGLFVTTINLEILSKFGKTVKEIAEALSGQNIKLKTEPEKSWRDFRIAKAKPADDKYQDYLPYIKIYDFPDQFMILVPAYETLDIAEKIVEEYERQFSKVRDRLPLHLGVIAFHRRTPLYVVMDAAKRLLKKFESSKTIVVDVERVEDMKDPISGMSKKLLLRVNKRRIPLKWVVSYSTKDPDVEDLWYPYLRLCNKGKPNRKLCLDYTGNGNYVVHIKEIKEGDELEIEPSYFKLCYIEEASDRFYVDENLKFLDDIHEIQNLWKIVERKLRSKKWTISQLYAFLEELEKIKEYNGETFEQFLRSSLINILDLDDSSNEYNLLKTSVEDSLFELCLYWNLQVRKEKIGKGDQNESL